MEAEAEAMEETEVDGEVDYGHIKEAQKKAHIKSVVRWENTRKRRI